MASPTEQTPLLGSGTGGDEENQTPNPTSNPTSVASRRAAAAAKAAPYGLLALLLFISIIILIIVVLAPNRSDGENENIISPSELARNILGHLREFERIAYNWGEDLNSNYDVELFLNSSSVQENDDDDDDDPYEIRRDNYHVKQSVPSRSVTTGHNASAQYVIGLLKEKTRCDTKLQYFKVPIWKKYRNSEFSVTFREDDEDEGDDVEFKENKAVVYQSGVDFSSMRYGGQAASLRGKSVVVIPDNGCGDGEEWEDLQDKVALVQAGGKCGFWDVAYKAEQKGAAAVIFYNSPKRKTLLYSRVLIADWKEGDPLMTIPVLSATYSLGQLLSIASNAVVNIETYTSITVVDTFNVICSWEVSGIKEDTIILGAHLDSVPAGPGLVDNASGSATLLEILLSLERAHFQPENHLVFAWWGAEELGLLGSKHYVRKLVESGKHKTIAMNMNFDMLGSPNFVPFIHRGRSAPHEVRNASVKIQSEFQDYFNIVKRPYELIDMYAGSDFLPFLQHGIPSGGVLTGAGGKKTADQRHIFGGFANAQYDPCYHSECDTFENINEEAIATMSQAALYTITRLSKKLHLRQYLGIPDGSRE